MTEDPWHRRSRGCFPPAPAASLPLLGDASPSGQAQPGCYRALQLFPNPRAQCHLSHGAFLHHPPPPTAPLSLPPWVSHSFPLTFAMQTLPARVLPESQLKDHHHCALPFFCHSHFSHPLCQLTPHFPPHSCHILGAFCKTCRRRKLPPPVTLSRGSPSSSFCLNTSKTLWLAGAVSPRHLCGSLSP